MIRILARIISCVLLLAVPLPAMAQAAPVGIVVMHGKGGSPRGPVAELAARLEHSGYIVANVEMPWSGKRNYDVDVSGAEREIESILMGLRSRGAKKIFVAGHSQGGTFALHLGGGMPVDGVIAIAPGGNAGSPVLQRELGRSLARARRLVAQGKGGEPAPLEDYESSRGAYPIMAPPAAYITWFEPDGAMNMERAARAARPAVPILWIVPRRDYPGLRRTSIPLFGLMPAHPLSRLYEPDADHRSAPGVSVGEIMRWTTEVAVEK